MKGKERRVGDFSDKRRRWPPPMILAMRQLTSLDAQFLAMEDGRTTDT